MHTELKKQIEKISGFVDLQFNSAGVVHPMWIADTASGEHKVYATPLVDKDVVAAFMRAQFALDDVVMVVFVTEAWTISPMGDAAIAEYHKWRKTHPSLEEYPGRKEAVVMLGEDKDGSIQATREIIRDGDKVTLGPLVWSEATHAEGRFVGMLPSRGSKTAH